MAINCSFFRIYLVGGFFYLFTTYIALGYEIKERNIDQIQVLKDEKGRLLKGNFKSFDEDGRLIAQEQYNNGVLEGEYRFYNHRNGYLSINGFYKNGKKNGLENQYALAGVLVAERMFKDGKIVSCKSIVKFDDEEDKVPCDKQLEMIDIAWGYSLDKINIHKIEQMIGKNPAFANFKENGLTLLFRASAVARVDIVKLLLKKGVDINLRNDDGKTALHGAVLPGFNDKDRPEIIQLLLKHGLNINVTTPTGWTPLHMAAAYKSSFAVFEMLLSSGANASAKTVFGKTPADVAKMETVANGLSHKDALTALRDIQREEEFKKLQAEMMFLNENDPSKEQFEQLESFLKVNPKFVNIPMGGITMLHDAVMRNNVAWVKLLLRFNADINALDHNGKTPLEWARQTPAKHNMIIEILLNHGAGIKVKK